MKVDNPMFDSIAVAGGIRCLECPFTNEAGCLIRAYDDLCREWGYKRDNDCPTAETYAEACELAAKVRDAGGINRDLA